MCVRAWRGVQGREKMRGNTYIDRSSAEAQLAYLVKWIGLKTCGRNPLHSPPFPPPLLSSPCHSFPTRVNTPKVKEYKKHYSSGLGQEGVLTLSSGTCASQVASTRGTMSR